MDLSLLSCFGSFAFYFFKTRYRNVRHKGQWCQRIVAFLSVCFVHQGSTDGTAFLECMCNGCACGRNSSVGAMSSRKAMHSTDMGVSPWCSKGFLSQHQIQCRLFFMVSVQHLYAAAYKIYNCMYIKKT